MSKTLIRDALVVGEWYWVRDENADDWRPAQHQPFASGGWTNNDAWQDFRREINEWKRLIKPDSFFENREGIARVQVTPSLVLINGVPIEPIAQDGVGYRDLGGGLAEITLRFAASFVELDTPARVIAQKDLK